jgi:hypothetical protein
MALITPKQATDYLQRWKIVREAQAVSLRQSSLETKLRQLNTLAGSRHLFSPDPDRERRVGEVRARWTQIRKALDV